ncbi:hypothetical protein K505DRAFT_147474 [Melanomma pulvis-pyrius CBS 109.77]|uniref:Uncharacterized protein n=1 Tax=Melanomma pulvis-pyrius CBS 109.77 TaxID=1314802 RepID=A0A6A6XL30_9PLEO|nr:hypothetical protein K505DRAFT_147474 [Melanomma pulvis-pyrius CBS 109.77]
MSLVESKQVLGLATVVAWAARDVVVQRTPTSSIPPSLHPWMFQTSHTAHVSMGTPRPAPRPHPRLAITPSHPTTPNPQPAVPPIPRPVDPIHPRQAITRHLSPPRSSARPSNFAVHLQTQLCAAHCLRPKIRINIHYSSLEASRMGRPGAALVPCRQVPHHDRQGPSSRDSLPQFRYFMLHQERETRAVESS